MIYSQVVITSSHMSDVSCHYRLNKNFSIIVLLIIYKKLTIEIVELYYIQIKTKVN